MGMQKPVNLPLLDTKVQNINLKVVIAWKQLANFLSKRVILVGLMAAFALQVHIQTHNMRKLYTTKINCRYMSAPVKWVQGVAVLALPKLTRLAITPPRQLNTQRGHL